jgi:outer membrane scaffolding protein for murein synthesis (MipA/OmpV family)
MQRRSQIAAAAFGMETNCLRKPFVRLTLSLVAVAALGATPAFAQDSPADHTDSTVGGDSITVGIGVGTVPTYEGSDKNRIVPVPAARGSIDGYAFSTRGAKLYVDLVRNTPGPGIDIQAGPVIGLNFNRTGSVDDPQVKALGKKKTALELGGYVGIGRTGVITSDYDKLSVSISYLHDVTGIHDSYVISPEVDYGTPLSRSTYVGVSASATYAGRGYARTYFGVTPAGSVASGLPVFYADKGWKNWSLSGFAVQSLTGDLTHGLALVGGVSYSRLMNDFAASPVTSIAGSRNQWMGAIGLAYTF